MGRGTHQHVRVHFEATCLKLRDRRRQAFAIYSGNQRSVIVQTNNRDKQPCHKTVNHLRHINLSSNKTSFCDLLVNEPVANPGGKLHGANGIRHWKDGFVAEASELLKSHDVVRFATCAKPRAAIVQVSLRDNCSLESSSAMNQWMNEWTNECINQSIKQLIKRQLLL